MSQQVISGGSAAPGLDRVTVVLEAATVRDLDVRFHVMSLAC